MGPVTRRGWARWPLTLGLAGLGWASLPAAGAVAAPGQVERAAIGVARALDGTIVACPETYARFTASKQCVRVPDQPERVKARLNRALSGTLTTAWRAQRNDVYAYNYLRQDDQLVGIIVGPATREGAFSIAVLDVVPDPVARGGGSGGSETVTIRPAPQPTTPPTTPPATPTESPPAAQRPAPTTDVRTQTPQASRLPAGFRRVLALRAPRQNGEDVRAVQNRLADLSGIARGGDGWFGPVTAATLRAFQAANGLPVSGVVDAGVWARLFARDARPFSPRSVDAYR